MSEYHISTGNLPLSVAGSRWRSPRRRSPGSAQPFQARLEEVREAMFTGETPQTGTPNSGKNASRSNKRAASTAKSG